MPNIFRTILRKSGHGGSVYLLSCKLVFTAKFTESERALIHLPGVLVTKLAPTLSVKFRYSEKATNYLAHLLLLFGCHIDATLCKMALDF